MLYSYVAKTVEQGGWTGVCRFDSALRTVFPELRSVTELPPLMDAADVVITDNHLSCAVPEQVRTIVVHHGSAAAHYERDPGWRNPQTRRMVDLQAEMLVLKNRTYVAPSRWVNDQFFIRYPHYPGSVLIRHWVPSIRRLPRAGKPVIIGDWRDSNKGAHIWQKLAAAMPEYEFQPLNFQDEAGRNKQYGHASAYLCLSLSEGAPYAVADAEAAGLPIVTTNVGNCHEFPAIVIDWRKRDDIQTIRVTLGQALARRRPPSFYRDYTFEKWAALWRELVQGKS